MSNIKPGLTLLLLVPLTTTSALAAEFTPLPNLPDATETRAMSVADDGNRVAGVVHFNSQARAFRWSSGDGQLTLVDDLPGGATGNQATAISGDGQAIVGFGASAQGTEAFVQIGNNPTIGLGDLAGGFFASHARGSSYDGSHLAGTAHSTMGREAFRWSAAAGLHGLGFLPNGVASEAQDINANGNVVVGVSETFDMIFGEAFRWTAGAGMVGLGDLPGGDAMSRATAVSSAGDVVVGQSSSTAGAQAFRWTAAGGMTGLGDLAGGGFSSVAHDVSADGSVIVGAGMTDDANPVAFVWTVDQGMRSLPELLADDYGIPTQLEGWNLIAAHSITPDAHAIVGTGINPDGRLQAWHVSLGQEMFMDGGHSTEDVQLRLGDRLQGHGELSGTVDIGAGATLSATNDFRLGSAATADAVRIGGRLLVNGQQVQLRSATPILVAGSIVMDSTDPSGEDCCGLHFDTLTLQGTIHGGQLVGRQLELQAGAVLGESAERPVLIESPVTGEGFLDYVEIRDGFAPGTTEPVELRLGNVRYRSAELALDLHGPADQYDRLRHDGTAEIIGSLQVRAEPREGYVPPIQGGQFDDFELVSAANLLLADDASIELVYDGQMLGSLTRAESALKLHAGNGLFRIVELEPFSLRLINYRAIAGDADGDGRFGTDDLVQVLQHGKYEDVLPLNADWTEGDWNLDGDFSSSDLVAALQTGAYEGVSQLPAVAAVPEPASATLALLAVAGALLAPSPLAALAGRG